MFHATVLTAVTLAHQLHLEAGVLADQRIRAYNMRQCLHLGDQVSSDRWMCALERDVGAYWESNGPAARKKRIAHVSART